MSSMPKFVKDPDGITHYLDPVPHRDEGWQTKCQRTVYFSAKWKSCFPFDYKPNCIARLAQ